MRRKDKLKKKIKKRTFPVWAVEDPEGHGMTKKEYLDTWQKLVDTGQAWNLQGWYGRTAHTLLKEGLIKFPNKKTIDYYGNPLPTRKSIKKEWGI